MKAGMLHRRWVLTGLTAATAMRATASVPLQPTPQEMPGPFYPEHPLPDHDFDLTRIRGGAGRARGEVIEVIGRVLRPDGTPVGRARIEVWQANAAGRYRNPNDTNSAPLDSNFQGYASLSSARDGSFRLVTVRPGAYPAPIGLRAPHIHFEIHSSEYRLGTQMYFAGEPHNAADPLLSTMPARRQNPNLVTARETAPSNGLRRYRWDVVLLS